MLPMESLPTSAQVRRAKQYELPETLARLADELLEQSGAGSYDPIEEVWNDRLAPETLAVRRAALRKYLGAAVAHGIIPFDCNDLKQAFDADVFYRVVRALSRETDPARRITARSLRQYVGIWMILGSRLGMSVDFMKDSLRHNATLKQGREEQKTMPRATREFCAALLRDRNHPA